MFGVAAFQLLLHLLVPAVPEAFKVLGHLNRLAGRRQEMEEHLYPSTSNFRSVRQAEHLLQLYGEDREISGAVIVGHLFQGRYRAILVDKDRYAMELSRYIHLNPVRAHMVKDPLLYPWSSLKDYAGERTGRGWVKTDWILGQISGNEKRARKGYRKFMGEGSGRAIKDPLEQVVSSTILGSEEFVDWVRERWVGKRAYHRDIPSLRKLSRWPGLLSIQREAERLFGKRAEESRRVALYLSHRLSGQSLGEIGSHFGGIGPSAVSQNTRRLEERLKGDPKLSEKVHQLKRILSELWA